MTDLMSVMTDDLATLFDLGGLTVPVEYRPATGAAVQLKGIYDEAWCEVDPKSRAPISSTGPAVHLQTGSIPAEPDEADRLVILGRTFLVNEPRPDGQGVTVYTLKEVRS
jgi:hypothetical protein